MPPLSFSVNSPRGISLIVISVIAGAMSFVVYYATAFRTITWWNSAECSLAAAHLGVMHPPGCLLGTILGWIIVKLAVCGSAAFALNLLAGLTASITAVMVAVLSGYYLRRGLSTVEFPVGNRTLSAVSMGAVIGALTLAYSQTFWSYANQFTPYIFTVLLTVLIIWGMIKWAGAGGSGPVSAYWLFVIALFFGLDFSVHRTNLLMAPGLIVWMLIFNPRSFLLLRTWVFGAAGLALGLAFHLLIIPMAAAQPFLNASSPDSWSGFWDYVTLRQLGGGFLVKFFPRNAPFWDVQVMDYLKAFSVNFFSWKGPIPAIGLLPGIFGIIGIIGLWRKNRCMALGLIVLFLLTSLGAILYFNIPANYFRSLFRHYMPSFVVFAVWIAFGLGSFIMAVFSMRRSYRWLAYPIIALLILAMPGYQIAKNFHRLDGSGNYFTQDYALNILTSLPDNSILITFGDNDTFPLWYYQVVEGIRPDITVLNNSLLNTSWFVRQCLRREPDLPLGIELTEVDNLRFREWPDTTVVIAIEGMAEDFNLAAGAVLPDSMYLRVPPTVSERYIMISDQLILNMIQANRWRRPIYIASTGKIGWLMEYLHFEGLVQRLTPIKNPPVNRQLLATNVLQKYSYRGYGEDKVFLDPTTKNMAINLLVGFVRLADAAYRAEDERQLETVKSNLAELIPVDRLRPLPENAENMLRHMETLEIESPG